MTTKATKLWIVLLLINVVLILLFVVFPTPNMAASLGRSGVLRLYIQLGVDIDKSDALSMTPFLIAAQNGQVDAMSLLLSHGAKMEERDWADNTALHLAARGGHLGAVRLLIERGSDPELCNHFNTKPEEEAARFDHQEVLRYLEAAKGNSTPANPSTATETTNPE